MSCTPATTSSAALGPIAFRSPWGMFSCVPIACHFCGICEPQRFMIVARSASSFSAGWSLSLSAAMAAQTLLQWNPSLRRPLKLGHLFIFPNIGYTMPTRRFSGHTLRVRSKPSSGCCNQFVPQECALRQLISMHAMVYESSYTTCECMAESAHHTPWHAY